MEREFAPVTIAAVLALPVVRAGLPEVLTAPDSLAAAVRWVHVSDSAGVAPLLEGGELLLSTGAGWPGDDQGLSDLAARLDDAGVAGVVLELGTRFTVAPPAFVSGCRTRGIPLVALDREVKFVAVTEAIHRLIIAGQLDALHQRDRLHTVFTALSLQGAPADAVVTETARALRTPVVLENIAREVIAADGAGEAEASFLGDWAVRSRRASEDREPGWTSVPVHARGVRWGTLLAAPGPDHAAGRTTVLEQAATALALARLADGEDGWALLSRRRLLGALVGGSLPIAADALARVEAAGFPVTGRTFVAVVSARPVSGSITAGSADVHVLAADVDGEAIVLLSLPRGATVSVPPIPDAGLAVGTATTTLPDLLATLPTTRLLAQRVPAGEVRLADDRPLARLVTTLHGDHRLQEHSERMLAPLLAHDADTGGDLVRVLGSLLRHPGNRTAAAAASHLSRSVFYQRLGLISDLLDADLEDGETLAALHLAYLASPARQAM